MSAEPLSYPVLAGDIPGQGKHFSFQADAEQRAKLAEAFGVPEVQSLEVELEIRPVRGRAFSVRGAVSADVVQNCVVTLEPVQQRVEEAVNVTLIRAEDVAPGSPRKDVLVDAAEADGPELYHNGRIDLGSIAREHVALGLDPYPRAAGVDFAGHLEDDPAADSSPFAALAKLKGQGG